MEEEGGGSSEETRTLKRTDVPSKGFTTRARRMSAAGIQSVRGMKIASA